VTVDDVLPAIGNSDHSTVSVCTSYSSLSTPAHPFYHMRFQFWKADGAGHCSFLVHVPWTSILNVGLDMAAEEIS